MTTPRTAPRLADNVLVTPGSGLVLAEWTADGATGDEDRSPEAIRVLWESYGAQLL
ncbi:hypothetical protein [Tenggerimyces flavus]|uniref:Uncharacterized protein n=1 Tax=Tenggerimyces flavus TaxID=1708749 RepID=A0ABV7Y2T9_9ACTN|nr:hypothetical protein [Tenggerimyces flavus]MBM7790603.1 hypothetical protein [Tenggerimyces flavus]